MPIVGSIGGVALIVSAWFMLWRYGRKQRAAALLNHELHGESAIKSELEAPNRPQELEVGNLGLKAVYWHKPYELEGNGLSMDPKSGL